MNTQSSTILTAVDSFVSRFDPINKLIDTIISKIAPHSIAKAVCQGNNHYCGSSRGAWCSWYCGYDGYTCRRYDVYHEIIKYDTTGTDCVYGTLTCDDGCDYIVHTGISCSPCPY